MVQCCIVCCAHPSGSRGACRGQRRRRARPSCGTPPEDRAGTGGGKHYTVLSILYFTAMHSPHCAASVLLHYCTIGCNDEGLLTLSCPRLSSSAAVTSRSCTCTSNHRAQRPQGTVVTTGYSSSSYGCRSNGCAHRVTSSLCQWVNASTCQCVIADHCSQAATQQGAVLLSGHR